MDNAKFCSNARGSCWEVLDHLITANDENMISSEILLVTHAVKLINGYMNYLKRVSKISAVKEDISPYFIFDQSTNNPDNE